MTETVKCDEHESGMSLVEVIVALTLLGVIAAAAATFFISGMSASNKLRQDQVAVSVASSALDAARAVSPRPPSDGEVSGLLKGRAQADVQAAFANADPQDIADLITADTWDPSGTSGSQDDWVPLTQTVTVANTTYKVTTLIGGCYRPKTVSTSAQQCVTTGWNANDYALMYRVRAVVTWGGKDCSEDQGCVYRAAVLIDPTRDYLWNTNLKPFAFDDEMFVDAGDRFTVEPQFTAVLANDEVIYQDGENPIEQLSLPKHGITTLSVPGFTYQPDDKDFSGLDPFNYRLHDAQGRRSEQAVVRVRVLPNPQDDDAGAVAAGESVDIDVMNNDYGTINGDGLDKELLVTLDPTIDYKTTEADDALIEKRRSDQQAVSDLGVTVNSDGTIRFDAPADATFGETVTFYYWLIDADTSQADGVRYFSNRAAKVSLLIGECINVADHDIEIDADKVGEFVDLEVNKLNDNKAGCLIKITDVEYPVDQRGQIRVGDNNYNAADNNTASSISYRFQEDTPFLFKITYVMYSRDGSFTTGEQGVLTIKIMPVATDDEYVVPLNSEFRPANAPTSRKLRDNDYPSGGAQVKIVIEQALPNNCGSFVPAVGANGELNNDSLVYQSPNTARVCTFTYRLIPTTQAYVDAGIRSKPATVTFTMGNQNIHSTITSVYSPYAQTPGISTSESVTSIMDKNSNTKWFVGFDSSRPTWRFPIPAIYTLSSAQTLHNYSITSGNDFQARDPYAWRIYGSNNAAAATQPNHNSWTQIAVETGVEFTSRKQTRSFTVSQPGAYRYYMIKVESTRNSNSQFQMADWTLEY